MSDALMSSPIVVGEDGAGAMEYGAGFEFGVDPNADPELALVSLIVGLFGLFLLISDTQRTRFSLAVICHAQVDAFLHFLKNLFQ